MAEKKDKQEIIQEKYMQMQMINQHLKQMQQQAEAVESQLGELMSTYQALEELKDIKPGTQMLVPISSGIFAKAEIKEAENLLVNVGSDTVVGKDLASTKALITAQLGELKEFHGKMHTEMQKLALASNALEEELGELVKDE